MHFEFYRVLSDTRATNSSNLESKSFRMGDWFDFLYPRTRSTVGVSPFRGRLVTDEGRKFCAYAGNSPTPRVDAIKDIPIARWSASWAGVMLIPDRFKYLSTSARSTGAVFDTA